MDIEPSGISGQALTAIVTLVVGPLVALFIKSNMSANKTHLASADVQSRMADTVESLAVLSVSMSEKLDALIAQHNDENSPFATRKISDLLIGMNKDIETLGKDLDNSKRDLLEIKNDVNDIKRSVM